MKTFHPSPFLVMIAIVLVVAVIYLLNDDLSLIMTYVIGAAGSFGIIGYFIFHKWNKKDSYKTDNIDGHNQ